jgi:hypothetical protein
MDRGGRARSRGGPGSILREPCDLQPEALDSGDYLEELAQPDGLGDETVGSELIRVGYIRICLRCGQDRNRYRLQVRVVSDLGEDCLAVFPGEVQIEKQKVRSLRRGVQTFFSKVSHSFDAVDRYVQLIWDSRPAQCFYGQLHIALAVFYEKNLNGLLVHDSPSSWMGRVKEMRVPGPVWSSTQIRP